MRCGYNIRHHFITQLLACLAFMRSSATIGIMIFMVKFTLPVPCDALAFSFQFFACIHFVLFSSFHPSSVT